jgi:1-acyl-sn-glycerol-3-phosphate acyltransferase
MTESVAVSASPVTTKDTEGADPGPPPSRLKRRAGRPEDRVVIRLLQAFTVCFARIYHQIIVRAPFRVPREGPAILVCNHTSGLDPMLIQSVSPRLIVWMMAKEYYDIKWLRWMFRTVEAIPVTRAGRDMAATRSALRALEQGRILGVFPEGKIEKTNALMPFQTGVAMMAIKTGVPVYPAYLDGTQRGKEMVDAFMYRNRVMLTFGPPVQFDRSSTSKEALQAATDRIAEAVAGLKTQSERRRGKQR